MGEPSHPAVRRGSGRSCRMTRASSRSCATSSARRATSAYASALLWTRRALPRRLSRRRVHDRVAAPLRRPIARFCSRTWASCTCGRAGSTCSVSCFDLDTAPRPCRSFMTARSLSSKTDSRVSCADVCCSTSFCCLALRPCAAAFARRPHAADAPRRRAAASRRASCRGLATHTRNLCNNAGRP